MNSQNMGIWVIIGALFIWSGILTYLYYRQQQFFKQFTAGVSKNDLKTILKQVSTSMKTVDGHLTDVDSKLAQLEKNAGFHIQKIGFIRFNPFSDTGGDQSFCVCLLNQHNDGLVITSLHSREQTRIYAKAIKAGKGQGATFFDEEKEAVKLAIQSGKKQLQRSNDK